MWKKAWKMIKQTYDVSCLYKLMISEAECSKVFKYANLGSINVNETINCNKQVFYRLTLYLTFIKINFPGLPLIRVNSNLYKLKKTFTYH